jgi:predicted alpha/beta hydrolase
MYNFHIHILKKNPIYLHDWIFFVCFTKQSFGKMNQSKIKIKCKDGIELSACLLIPDGVIKAVVQINSATAAPKEFYLPFAQYLTDNQYVTCVFDYRGVCESTPVGGLRGCEYTYLEWAEKDMTDVLDFLDERFPNLPKYIVGHSVGGQKFGFMKNLEKVSGLVTFASSVGYWGFMPFGYRMQTHFFFQIFTPISNFLFGYVAAKKLGLMEDLPKNIVLAWRDWCSVPEYFFNEKYYGKTVPKGSYDSLNFPIKVFWTTDDPISNYQSIPMFWKHIKSSQGIDIEKLIPESIGVKEIGHFGFFRKKFKENLWSKALSELNKWTSVQ